MPKTVLITGCSAGGIGYALAQAFQARGLTVFATARNTSKISALEKLPNTHLLSLDVTDPVSVAAAVEAVKAKAGGKLDYLVNNSGRGYVMAGLDSDIDEGKKLFEVNLWGVVRVVQAFAPLLIEAKGTIATIGSAAGLAHIPYMSFYNASKSAVHIFDETLRLELAPLGVNVLTVVVGGVKTAFHENNPMNELPTGSKYSQVKGNMEASANATNGMAQTKVEDFAKNVVNDVLGGVTGRTYRGAQASVARLASALFPWSLMDRILLKGTGLDSWKR